MFILHTVLFYLNSNFQNDKILKSFRGSAELTSRIILVSLSPESKILFVSNLNLCAVILSPNPNKNSKH